MASFKIIYNFFPFIFFHKIFNGSSVYESLDFPPTGSFANWSVSSSRVYLNAGTHRIALLTFDSEGPNVDNLVFGADNPTPLARSSTSEITIAPKTLTSLNAYVYPNPVKDIAKLKLSTSSSLPVNLQLVDLLGRTYKLVKFTYRDYSTVDFSVKDLPAGYYTILVKQGNLSTHVRLIVEK